ncbi:hypothetical protein ACLOJK_033420 [Asimina triloba]
MESNYCTVGIPGQINWGPVIQNLPTGVDMHHPRITVISKEELYAHLDQEPEVYVVFDMRFRAVFFLPASMDSDNVSGSHTLSSQSRPAIRMD